MSNNIKQKIIHHIKDRLNDLLPGTKTIDAYEQAINKMSDKELEEFIQALENGVQDFPDPSKPATTISLIVPNLVEGPQLEVERNLKLADKMGYDFFEQLWLTDPVTGQTYLTNKRYLCIHLPIRRQAQTLDHKISVAADDSKVDDLTGQVTGESKGSGVSYPEIQMLDGQGLTNTINELIRARGGDEEAWRIMKRQIIDSGEFNNEVLDKIDTRAKVNESFRHILSGMHIKNNV